MIYWQYFIQSTHIHQLYSLAANHPADSVLNNLCSSISDYICLFIKLNISNLKYPKDLTTWWSKTTRTLVLYFQVQEALRISQLTHQLTSLIPRKSLNNPIHPSPLGLFRSHCPTSSIRVGPLHSSLITQEEIKDGNGMATRRRVKKPATQVQWASLQLLEDKIITEGL